MYYNEIQGEKLSALGFGTMRLPTLSDGSVDEAAVAKMIACAFENGVNYFDTAMPYHGGESERIVGKILKQYPRDSFYLASKFPGHQVFATYDCAGMFADQLERCGVDYFDFYLLHNVSEASEDTYYDARWSIPEYFIEQKKAGKIRHLGFSSHGGVKMLEEFLKRYGEYMEFCLLQINYLDWTLQDAKAKYELLTRYNIPIMVMEPLRGGALCKLSDEQLTSFDGKGAVEVAFRFLQQFENIKVVLSGMSSLPQMTDNVKYFTERKPLTEAENAALMEIAEGMKDSVPCTACRYCVDGCPMGLDIPEFLAMYNEFRVAKSLNVSQKVEFMPEDKKPTACISCGACLHSCPQNIDIPACLAHFSEMLASMPSWRQISKEREAALLQQKNK